MDHAGWVERNIAAHRSLTTKAGKPAKVRRDRQGTARGWTEAPEKLTEFQARVFDILGMVGGGIYNCPISWDDIYWRHGGGLGIPWRHGHFATFDFANLTRLVFLCHEARIRCELSINGRGWLIGFWQRSHFGDTGTRHPNLDEAVAEFRQYLPANHHIIDRRHDLEPCPECRCRVESCGHAGCSRAVPMPLDAAA